MIFLKSKLRQLRRDSAPDAAFKAALRSRLLASDSLIAYTTPMSAFRYVFAAVALILVAGFGTTTYAYTSPSVTEGDALYPIKTRIESVEGGFQHTPEAQARFQARMMNRRMNEVFYRLQHNEPVPTQLKQTLSEQMSLSVSKLHDLHGSDAQTEFSRYELRTKVEGSLSQFRSRVFMSDLPDEHKQEYLDAIDKRLEKLEDMETAP
jgi:hypothetical protein